MIREFSDLTGIPYRTLQDYLGDKSKPGAEQLARISAVGLDVNLLLTGTSRRFGYLIDDAAPPDDESHYILADLEILEAIDRKAKEAITETLKRYLKPDETLTFDFLFAAYMQMVGVLTRAFARAAPPIEEARKLGMSVGKLIDLTLDGVVQITAAKLLVRAEAERLRTGS